MKNLLVILLFLASTSVFAQRITITGTVTDEDRAPLPGATVQVKGAVQGTTTNADGKYSVDVNSTNDILVFSFVGFITQEIPVQNQTVINAALSPDILGLQEVIVVGYGTQKRSDITGTVASLPKERLEMAPNLNIAQAIQGSVAGVMIQNTSAGAQPDQTILVRGRNSITANNDPLIIVDGIPYGGQVTDINPNDVQSIEVLKDASAAAIYGSRGANGVILITTKEGIVGKTSFSYEGKYSISDVTKVNRMLTGPEFYDFKMTRNAAAMTLSEEQVYQDGTWTDWTKLATRMGQTQEHNLSVSGGFNNTKYYIGGGITDIKGVAKNDDFRRLTSRINVETKLTDWLSVGTRTQLSFDDASGAEANFEVSLETNPLGLAYDEYGNYTIFPWPDNIIVGNPLGPLLYDDLNKSYQILTNNYVAIDVPFIQGLSYRLNTGVRMRFTDRAQYRGRDTQSGLADLGRASISNSVSSSTVIENILSYTREFGDHTIFATALYSYEGNNGKTNSLNATKFPNDFLSWYAAAQATNVMPSNSFSESALVSQMLRLNYSFASRYLVTLTVRRDGFSGFGEDTKWGTFPSVALGWNLANEGFFPLKNLFNELKLRGSYGLNGNQAIGAYESLSQFIVANNIAGSETVIGYKPAKMGVANLGWESSATMNLGLDFGLFENRISGNINWYLTNTSDLLLDRSISVIHGITPNTHLPSWVHPAVTENIGKTRNTGVELVINSRNIVRSKFQWSTTGNLSFNKNEIVSLYGVLDENGKEVDDISNGWFIGQPIRVNYDYVWDGVWQLDEVAEAATYGSQPGYVKLKDIDGNGVLDANDRQIIGQVDPKLLWGLTNTFSYSNFTLSIFMHGVSGSTVENYLMNDNVQGAEVRYNTLKKNWWTPTNPTNDWVMNAELANNMSGFSGTIYEKPDFVRIKDVSLSYDLPKSMISKIGLSRLRFYVTGRNLVTFTKWTGMDPDLVDEDSQQDIPMQKEYVFGLSLGF
jgi:TonB-linked SusC/RagA family outer membrane protein